MAQGEVLIGFDILANATATINGVSNIPVIFNTSTHRDNKLTGGYEPSDEFFVMAKTSALTAPKTLKGKVIIIDSESYRVISVKYGVHVTGLYCQSLDQS